MISSLHYDNRPVIVIRDKEDIKGKTEQEILQSIYHYRHTTHDTNLYCDCMGSAAQYRVDVAIKHRSYYFLQHAPERPHHPSCPLWLAPAGSVSQPNGEPLARKADLIDDPSAPLTAASHRLRHACTILHRLTTLAHDHIAWRELYHGRSLVPFPDFIHQLHERAKNYPTDAGDSYASLLHSLGYQLIVSVVMSTALPDRQLGCRYMLPMQHHAMRHTSASSIPLLIHHRRSALHLAYDYSRIFGHTISGPHLCVSLIKPGWISTRSIMLPVFTDPKMQRFTIVDSQLERKFAKTMHARGAIFTKPATTKAFEPIPHEHNPFAALPHHLPPHRFDFYTQPKTGAGSVIELIGMNDPDYTARVERKRMSAEVYTSCGIRYYHAYSSHKELALIEYPNERVTKLPPLS